MNTATRILTRGGLNRLVILVCTLLPPAIQLRALIITTNCPEVAASLPQPKRIQSGCPAIGPLGYFAVLPQFSSGGIYHIFANNPAGVPSAFGLGWSDANGVFNWKVACSNGFIAPLSAQ